MSARQHILNSIRTALKEPFHLPAEPTNDELPAQIVAAAPKSLEGKIARFKAELSAIAGECEQVSTFEQTAVKIAAIMHEASAGSVAVAGGRLTEQTANELRRRGIETISPKEAPEAAGKTTVAEIKIGLVEAAFAVADSGTIAVPFVAGRSTLPHFLPEIVIALVPMTALVADHFELFQKLTPDERRSMLLVTGPSRTADIEKILILGAHGPRRLIVLLIGE